MQIIPFIAQSTLMAVIPQNTSSDSPKQFCTLIYWKKDEKTQEISYTEKPDVSHFAAHVMANWFRAGRLCTTLDSSTNLVLFLGDYFWLQQPLRVEHKFNARSTLTIRRWAKKNLQLFSWGNFWTRRRRKHESIMKFSIIFRCGIFFFAVFVVRVLIWSLKADSEASFLHVCMTIFHVKSKLKLLP